MEMTSNRRSHPRQQQQPQQRSDDSKLQGARKKRENDTLCSKLLSEYVGNASIEDVKSERVTAIMGAITQITQTYHHGKIVLFSTYFCFINILERAAVLHREAAATSDPVRNLSVHRIDGTDHLFGAIG